MVGDDAAGAGAAAAGMVEPAAADELDPDAEDGLLLRIEPLLLLGRFVPFIVGDVYEFEFAPAGGRFDDDVG